MRSQEEGYDFDEAEAKEAVKLVDKNNDGCVLKTASWKFYICFVFFNPHCICIDGFPTTPSYIYKLNF